MPSCIVKNCRSHSRNARKSEGITFHRFFHPGHQYRDQWIQFVRKSRNDVTWLPADNTYICSLHFKDEDKYSTKTARTYLKKCAVPIDNTTFLNHESQSASPDEATLSKEMQMESNFLEELTAKKALTYDLQIERRCNRYLKRKCECYRNIISSLIQKYGIDIQAESDLITNAIRKDTSAITISEVTSLASSIEKQMEALNNVDLLDIIKNEEEVSTVLTDTEIKEEIGTPDMETSTSLQVTVKVENYTSTDHT